MDTTKNGGSVGRHLRATREAAGLTRNALARLTGCSITSLANIEQGTVPRQSRVLDAAFEAIADYLREDEQRADAFRKAFARGGDG